MRTIKKFVAAGAVTLLLVAGVGTPAQAAKGGGMQPMGNPICTWAPWIWFC